MCTQTDITLLEYPRTPEESQEQVGIILDELWEGTYYSFKENGGERLFTLVHSPAPRRIVSGCIEISVVTEPEKRFKSGNIRKEHKYLGIKYAIVSSTGEIIETKYAPDFIYHVIKHLIHDMRELLDKQNVTE